MPSGPSEIFRDKPELIIGIINDYLDSAEVKRLAGKPGLAIVELAGRDSVAAALAAVKQHGLEILLPTYVYTGSEHGPFSWVEEAHARLASRLPAGVKLLKPLVVGSPGFWRALNGGLLGELSQRYGFPPVCVGCHLYLHAARIPLARHLGVGGKGVPIISGERESHDNKLKLNQVAPALDAYAGLCAEFGVELMLPIRQVDQGARIEEILGLAWPEGGEQVSCVLSGNYRGCGGEINYNPDALMDFLDEFALPLTRRILIEYLAGGIPKHMDLATKLMRGIASPAKDR
jgi:hypothetical protein